jgi:hypothetical protein
MTNTQAQLDASRALLRALVKESPYPATYIAEQIGEPYTSLLHRLKGTRATFRGLDTSVVINILAVLEIPVQDFFVQVVELAALAGDVPEGEYATQTQARARGLLRKE